MESYKETIRRIYRKTQNITFLTYDNPLAPVMLVSGNRNIPFTVVKWLSSGREQESKVISKHADKSAIFKQQ
jgi:hypothetical protein